MNNQAQIILLANILHVTTAALAKTASEEKETALRSRARRLGQDLALKDSVGIELKNHVTVGVM